MAASPTPSRAMFGFRSATLIRTLRSMPDLFGAVAPLQLLVVVAADELLTAGPGCQPVDDRFEGAVFAQSREHLGAAVYGALECGVGVEDHRETEFAQAGAGQHRGFAALADLGQLGRAGHGGARA